MPDAKLVPVTVRIPPEHAKALCDAEGGMAGTLRELINDWYEQLLADRFVEAYAANPLREDEMPGPPAFLDPWDATPSAA